MKKLFIIELFHHHECVENPYIFHKLNNFVVKVITTSFVAENLKEIPKKDIHILKNTNRKKFDSLSNIEKTPYVFNQFFNNIFILRQIKFLIKKEKPSYLHINTVETPFAIPLLIYLFFIKTPIILTLHNTNRLKVDFKKYFFFDFLIKSVIKKAKKIVLLGPYLKLNSKYDEKVIYLNNRPISTKKEKKFEKITFVITGNLNTDEKDNELIFRHFQKLLKLNHEIGNRVQLILLSKINYKYSMLLEKYDIKKISKTYSSFVKEDHFEKIMLKSHYVILSTKKDSIYGKYKISGSFGDAVGFNLPILVNDHFAPDYKDKQVIRFNEDNLYKVLNKLIKK